MKCSNCGADIINDQKFCNLCGNKTELKNNNTYEEKVETNNYRNKNLNSGSFIKFDKMITPSIIQVIFFIGIIISAIASFVMAIRIGGIFGFFGGILMFLVLSIAMRLYCELVIVIFKIHECLVEINNK